MALLGSASAISATAAQAVDLSKVTLRIGTYKGGWRNLLAAAGQTAPQIAPLVRRSVDTVQRVLRRYQREGLAGLPHRPRPGRPVAVPATWQAELLRVIELDPHSVGVPSAIWTTRLLADYLARTTGHRAGIETVRRQLHQAGYVCKRPTWTLRRKAAEQPEWAKNA